MRLVLAQTNPLVGGVRRNLEALERIVRSLASPTDLVVFPELALTGYPPRDLLADPALLHAEAEALAAVARLSQSSGVGILLGHTESHHQSGPPLFNAASLFDEGRLIARVRKQRLTAYDIFEEERFFKTWSGGPQGPFLFRGFRLGLFICEDAWDTTLAFGREDERQQDIASSAAPNLKGAQLLINLSASPYTLRKRRRREAVFATHARIHAAPLVFCGSVGGQDGLLFDGASFALNAQGEVQAQAQIFEEDLLALELSPQGEWSRVPPRHLPKPHEPWDEMARGLRCGIRDYVHKTGFSSVLLGLSGGIDSALVAVLAAQALGPENVFGVSLPSQLTSDPSRDDARGLAQNLGLSLREISIAGAVEAHLQALKMEAQGLLFENLQSRNRGILLMALSNQENRLLLSTGNKSEMAVGYATLYGDLCGALAPLGDLYKTEVYGLAHWLQAQSPVFPLSTLLKAPTAELAPGQKDSDSLPHYAVLDAALEDLLDNQGRRLQNWGNFLAPHFHTPADLIRRVRSMEYKRYQAPPILKVHGRAFGSGWKMPLAKEISS